MKYIKTFKDIIFENLTQEQLQKSFDDNIGSNIDKWFLKDIIPFLNKSNVANALTCSDMWGSDNPELERYVLDNFDKFICDQNSTRIMIAAVKHNNFKIVKKCIEKYYADANFSALPLTRAAKNDNIEIVKYLIKHGADVNKSEFILSNAAEYNNYENKCEVLEYLLELGLLPNRFSLQRGFKNKKAFNMQIKKMDEILEKDSTQLKKSFWKNIFDLPTVKKLLPEWFVDKWEWLDEVEQYTN